MDMYSSSSKIQLIITWFSITVVSCIMIKTALQLSSLQGILFADYVSWVISLTRIYTAPK